MTEKEIFIHQLVATSKHSSKVTATTCGRTLGDSHNSGEVTMAIEEYQLRPQQRPKKKKKPVAVSNHQRHPSIADRIKSLQHGNIIEEPTQRKISIQESLKNIMQSTQLKLESPDSARSIKRLTLVSSVPTLNPVLTPVIRRISKQQQQLTT